jgi:hypothetical protein
MTMPRQPQESTLGELAQYQELISEAGRELIAAEDDLITAEQRAAAREARRRGSGSTADAVGRGRV